MMMTPKSYLEHWFRYNCMKLQASNSDLDQTPPQDQSNQDHQCLFKDMYPSLFVKCIGVKFRKIQFTPIALWVSERLKLNRALAVLSAIGLKGMYIRAPDWRAIEANSKIIFLVSEWKYMLWPLIRTASVRQF